MKSSCLRHWLLAALLGLSPNLHLSAEAQEVQLQPAQPLYAGASPIDLGDYAIPCVTDWNGDGRKDLLAGYRSADKIALFLDVGSDASPVFTNFINVQAGGTDIYVGGSGCGAPAPFVCDYDNDGRRDLLVGDGSYGYVNLYRNTNTDAAPILEPGVRLLAAGTALSVGSRATPYVCDWNADGLNDLLCGAGDGCVYFFKNVGTAQTPIYGASTRIQAGGADLNLGMRSIVRRFDWDGDGVKDLAGSSATGVYWCRNVGSDEAPSLRAPVALRAPAAAGGLAPINTGARMRLELVDWNNDGAIDLLLGNVEGTISYFEGYRFAFTACDVQGSQTPVLQWRSAPNLSYHVLAGPSLDSITNFMASNVLSAGTVTCWTNAAAVAPQFYRLKVAP